MLINTCHFFWPMLQQGKCEGFDSCDRPSNLTQIGFKSLILSLCYLEIWWMTSKNDRTPLLYYVKLCASFQIHRWIQTGVTVRKCSIRVKISDFLSCVTLKFDGRPWKNNRSHLLCCFKLCASLQSHRWIQTWVTVRKRLNRVKIDDFFVPRDLEI